MKQKLLALSRHYLATLQRRLQEGAKPCLAPARFLGAEAAGLGLETLDLARIHEIALASLTLQGYSSSMRHRMNKQADAFFTEATAGIEATHGPAVEGTAKLHQLRAALGRRTEQLAASRRELKRGVADRKATQAELKRRAGRSARLLERARLLQAHLLRLTRQVFITQESERRKMSRELNNDIAQTLLGVNVHLLALRRATEASSRTLHHNISDTEQVVENSFKTLLRAARAGQGTSPGRRLKTKRSGRFL